MSPEIPNTLSNIEIRSRKAFPITGELTEEQKQQIEQIVNLWTGKFLFCTNQEDDTKYLVVFISTHNHLKTWDLITKNHPEFTLNDAGGYYTDSGIHTIKGYSISLTNHFSIPNEKLLNEEQMNQSREYLRETLGIEVEDVDI